jgi:hypothetical protein
MEFKQWLLQEDDMRSGAKLGLYPSLVDSIGQYPPLYVASVAADFITYYGIEYGKKPLKFIKPGFAEPKDLARHDAQKKIWTIPD